MTTSRRLARARPPGRDESTKRALVLLSEDSAAAEVGGSRSRSTSPRSSGGGFDSTSNSEGVEGGTSGHPKVWLGRVSCYPWASDGLDAGRSAGGDQGRALRA